MRRLLNLIPWVEASGSHGASLAELSAEFDYPVEVLVDDLTQVVNFVTGDRYGLYGHNDAHRPRQSLEDRN